MKNQMKIIFFLAAAIWSWNIAAGDYAVLMREGAAARNAKNHQLAAEKFAQALQAAGEAKPRFQAVVACAAALQAMKQPDRARDLYEEELKKDLYSNTQRQSMLVKIAAMYLWDRNHYQYALDKINLALALKGVREDEPLYFLMCNYAACIYRHFKKEYDPIIVLCEIPAARSRIAWHKWTLYSQIAQAYEQLGKKAEALENYRLAIEFGRKAKRDTKKLEAKIKELSK